MSDRLEDDRPFAKRLFFSLRAQLLAVSAGESGSAYSFAIVCVAVAAVSHEAFSHFVGNITPSVVYYPAVLSAAIVGGVRAGAVAAFLSSILVWWAFESPYFGARVSPATELVNRSLYVVATILIIYLAERFRRTEPSRDHAKTSSAAEFESDANPNGHKARIRRVIAKLRGAGSGGLSPNSISAYLFAFACIAFAALVRLVLGSFGSDVLPFACYYPAVLLAALVGGMGAGLAAVFLSMLIVGWSLLPGHRPFESPAVDQIASCALYVLASFIAVWIAGRGRRILICWGGTEAQVLDYVAPAIVSLAGVLLTTIVLLSFEPFLQGQHLVLAYLLPATLIATAYGSAFAFLASFASAVMAAYFFFPPKFSLYVADTLHVAELGFFIVFALIASKVVAVLTYEIRYDVRTRSNRALDRGHAAGRDIWPRSQSRTLT